MQPLLEGGESDWNDLSRPRFHLPHLVVSVSVFIFVSHSHMVIFIISTINIVIKVNYKVPGLVGGGTSDWPPKNSPCWQQVLKCDECGNKRDSINQMRTHIINQYDDISLMNLEICESYPATQILSWLATGFKKA